MKKTLAIVSSYHELCGISTYTETLENEFRKHFEVHVISLDLDLLNSSNAKIRKLGDAHIRHIAKELESYDYVNIQFESGLYGSYPNEIYKRIKILIQSTKNLIMTLHSVYAPVSFFDRNVLKQIMASGPRVLRDVYAQTIYPRLYRKIIDALRNHSDNHHHVHIMVHNLKDKNTVKLLYNFPDVEAFPLTYLNQGQKNALTQNYNAQWFREKYDLSDKDVVIGLFGFVTRYKGYDTALNALKLLPSNYKIIICGAQHPMSIKPFEVVEPYIGEILKLIDTNKKILKNRILWAGSLQHDEFVHTMRCCDYVVLPYTEVNQSGSGIATLALETGAKCLFSNSKTFTQLKKFYPDCFDSFDIGNYRELACKIAHYKSNHSDAVQKCMETYNIENNILTYKRLFEKGNEK